MLLLIGGGGLFLLLMHSLGHDAQTSVCIYYALSVRWNLTLIVNCREIINVSETELLKLLWKQMGSFVITCKMNVLAQKQFFVP